MTMGIVGRLGGGAVPFAKAGVLTPPTPNYDPIAALGSDLIEYWDASRADTITTTTDATYTNVVSSWLGLVLGSNLATGTPSLKPTYQSNGMGDGRPCIAFDGVQQYLTCTDSALMAALPDGAEPCELWALCSQDVAGTDATTRHLCGYAATSVINGRSIARLGVSSVNRARVYAGTGAAASTATGTAVDFSGIHVARGIIGASSSSIDLDGGTKTSVSVVPVTSTPALFRVGCIPASAASNYWSGKIAAVLVTKPLSDDKAAALHGYLG